MDPLQQRRHSETTTPSAGNRTMLAWLAVAVWLAGSLAVLWRLEYDDALRNTLCLSRPAPSLNPGKD